MKTANALEGSLRLFLILWGILLFFGLGGSCLVTGLGYGNDLINNDLILRQIEFHNNNFLATLLLGAIYYISKVQGQNVIRLLLFYTFLASLFLTIQIFLRCHVMPTIYSIYWSIETIGL